MQLCMRPERDDGSYILDMAEYARRTAHLTQSRDLEVFLTDETLAPAVKRYLEIIGEAGAHLSTEFRQRHQDVQWRRVIGLRNVLIHGYAQVNPLTVWRIATEEVPELLIALERLILESGLQENT